MNDPDPELCICGQHPAETKVVMGMTVYSCPLCPPGTSYLFPNDGTTVSFHDLRTPPDPSPQR